MNWKEVNSFYYNDKGVIDFCLKCYKCKKPCKQSCNIISMRCKNYEKADVIKTKSEQVIEFWKNDNPNGTIYRCVSDTGLAKNTVAKYF